MDDRKVTFCVGIKPPNYGAMKIHTNKTKRPVIDNENDIKLIMFQTNVTYEIAKQVYIKFDRDIVNSIMHIEDQDTCV